MTELSALHGDTPQPNGRVDSLGSVVDAITNVAMQALAAELRRQGKGGRDDTRLLRRAVREVVRRSLRDVGELVVSEEAAPVAKPAATPGVPVRVTATPAEYAEPCSVRPWSGPLVVRPRQACEMLAIGLTRLYELLNEGALESYLHGGSRRITIASIRAYIDRHLKAGQTT
jgi:excisionase family DNA binding protein